MPTRTDPAKAAAREARVVALRRARTPWDSIAKDVGVSASRCHQIYQRALANNPLTGIQIDEHRLEETELIDVAVRNLLGIAISKDTSARTRVEAWSALRAWAERKAKLLGLDAPQKHEVVTVDYLDQQIAALEAELAGGTPAGEAAPASGTRS